MLLEERLVPEVRQGKRKASLKRLIVPERKAELEDEGDVSQENWTGDSMLSGLAPGTVKGHSWKTGEI